MNYEDGDNFRVMSTFNRTSHNREEDAGKEFPLRFSCSIFLGGVSLLLGFIPWLALTIPTAPRTDLPWFHNPMIYQYNGQNASGLFSRFGSYVNFFSAKPLFSFKLQGSMTTFLKF